MFERVWTILIKEFIQVFRDPRMKSIIFIAPVIQVLVFGYAARTDVDNIPTAVYDLDNTKETREILRAFKYSKYFDVKYYVYDDESQRKLIDESSVNVVIRFNRGFSRALKSNKAARFQLIVDGTDSNMAQVILSYANKIVQDYSYSILLERSRIYLQRVDLYPKVDLRNRSWFNENLESKNYYLPGVIALMVTVTTLLLSSMAVVREKEIGTMEQLIVSPIKPVEFILGKLTPFGIIALVNMALITLVGVLWFKVPIRGSIFLLFGSTVIYLLTSLGVGLFISTVSSTQQEAVMSTFLFFFPANLLSGFIFPISNMPRIVQYITYINPLRYYLIILRGVFLKGVGIGILWPEIIILFALGAGIIVLSSLRFKKRLG